jgi:ribosomal protein L32
VKKVDSKLEFGDWLPKVRKPKSGWYVPRKKKRRSGPRVAPSERGLPPCPACGEWSMQKDSSRVELYCGACGAIMGNSS